jgi:hypothetical protein
MTTQTEKQILKDLAINRIACETSGNELYFIVRKRLLAQLAEVRAVKAKSC